MTDPRGPAPAPKSSSDIAWEDALNENDVDIWVEHLDRVELCDHFPYLEHRGALRIKERQVHFSAWLQAVSSLDDAELFDAHRDATIELTDRFAIATYARWITSLQRLLIDHTVEGLPQRGVVQYFSDGLEFNVLVGYRRAGSTVEIRGLLVIPKPTAYADPILALPHARNSDQLELLRKSLYSRHKVLVQRNTLIHVDREASSEVFGPTIDTLLLNDWMFDHRYQSQRIQANNYFFEDPLTAAATRESLREGFSFLEIGCGNGLLTATFARNEARVRKLAAIDVSIAAVATTYRNSAHQRQLHRGAIGDRGQFIVARYDSDIAPLGNDVVVCNPPYVPLPEDSGALSHMHPLAQATLGTDLLKKVVSDAPKLVASNGYMGLVASELARPEIEETLPAGWKFERVRHMRVPFQLEVANDAHAPDYVKWLTEERGLIRSGDANSYRYEHEIAVFMIQRDHETEGPSFQ